ncbi:uncharacterized protein M6B38_163985 [Iris pallida]|uniref:Uncharacterized protein n=1 Tax=Iris pallida TaxID=29817 RepID=A0AAX6EYJ7_IRIPA|nr:uncharacterized protein M6B38_163985 [Iris pallida]
MIISPSPSTSRADHPITISRPNNITTSSSNHHHYHHHQPSQHPKLLSCPDPCVCVIPILFQDYTLQTNHVSDTDTSHQNPQTVITTRPPPPTYLAGESLHVRRSRPSSWSPPPPSCRT